MQDFVSEAKAGGAGLALAFPKLIETIYQDHILPFVENTEGTQDSILVPVGWNGHAVLYSWGGSTGTSSPQTPGLRRAGTSSGAVRAVSRARAGRGSAASWHPPPARYVFSPHIVYATMVTPYIRILCGGRKLISPSPIFHVHLPRTSFHVCPGSHIGRICYSIFVVLYLMSECSVIGYRDVEKMWREKMWRRCGKRCVVEIVSEDT